MLECRWGLCCSVFGAVLVGCVRPNGLNCLLGDTRLDPGEIYAMHVWYGFGGGWVLFGGYRGCWKFGALTGRWGSRAQFPVVETARFYSHTLARDRADNTRGLGVVVVVLCWLGVVNHSFSMGFCIQSVVVGGFWLVIYLGWRGPV